MVDHTGRWGGDKWGGVKSSSRQVVKSCGMSVCVDLLPGSNGEFTRRIWRAQRTEFFSRVSAFSEFSTDSVRNCRRTEVGNLMEKDATNGISRSGGCIGRGGLRRIRW